MCTNLIALLLMLALSGCVASNLAEVIEKAGQSEATVCVTITTIYGTGKVFRSNIQNGNVNCDMEGMTIRDRSKQ
jgi:hypothetical protein